jgi:prevent-host-death family protein
MSQHSVADAETQLDALIDRALAGEGIVITRHGQPIAELKPVEATDRPNIGAALDRLAALRVGGKRPSVDAGQLVSEMRDEDGH